MPLVLINPPIRVHPSNIASGIATPPLWAASLAALMKEAGEQVRVLDMAGEGLSQQWRLGEAAFRGLTPEEAVARLPDDVSIIGVSCMFSSTWPMVRFLLGELHRVRPQAVLVLGGEHVTALPELSLGETPADVAVLGEGEESLLALVQAMREHPDRRDFSGIPGLIWKDAAGTLHDEGRRKRLRDLDALPRPDWTGVPVAAYMAQKSGVGANRGPFMPLLGTRGCPHECTFCASPAMWTTSYHMRSPKAVAAEMAALHEVYGATDFQFQDLTAIVSKKWTHELCTEIRALGKPFTWQLPSGTRSEAVDEALARDLAAAGLTNLAFAFENGDPKVLAATKKRAKTDRQIAAARALIQGGVRVGGFLVIGHPSETYGSLWRTFLLVLRLARAGISEVNLSTFVPVPGSEDFHRLRAEGRLTVDDRYYDNLFNWLSLGRQVSYHPRFSHRLIRAFVPAAYAGFFALSFLLRPTRLVAELKALALGQGDKGKLAKVLRGWRTLRALPVVARYPAAGASAP